MVTTDEAQRDGMLREYDALRAEIRDRVTGQGRAGAGAVALVSGFIGVLAAVKTEGDESLIASVLGQPEETTLSVFCFLCAGFTLGIELVLTYWAYQLFAMFRMARYLNELETEFKSKFGISDDALVLSWGRVGGGMQDVVVAEKDYLSKWSVRVVSMIQPVSLFALGGLGLFGMLISARGDAQLWVIFCLLATGIIGIGLIMFGVHKWIIGEGATPFSKMGVLPAPADPSPDSTTDAEEQREGPRVDQRKDA